MDRTLAVTPFEHYMWLDSNLDIEMGDCYRFQFEGKFDRTKFERALRHALTQHPLLTSKIIGRKAAATRSLRWIPSLTPPIIHWRLSEYEAELPPAVGRMIDIKKEPPLRVIVSESSCKTGVETELLLQVHHSASDASGVFQFVEDTLLAYQKNSSSQAITQRTWDHASLANRNKFVRRTARGLLSWVYCWQRIAKFFSMRPVQIALKPKSSDAPDFEWPPALSTTLRPETFESLRGYARRAGITLNDLMLAKLFCCIDKWNLEHSHSSSKRHYRIAMAINMRDEDDSSMPAANKVSMCYIDAKTPLDSDAIQLLDKIGRETKKIKSYDLGYAMIDLLALAGRVPGLLGWAIKPHWPMDCMTTTALSNLGRPFAGSPLMNTSGRVEVTGAKLLSIEAMPSGRPYLPVAFTMNSYGGRFMLTISYDRARLCQHDAQELLDLYVNLLCEK